MQRSAHERLIFFFFFKTDLPFLKARQTLRLLVCQEVNNPFIQTCPSIRLSVSLHLFYILLWQGSQNQIIVGEDGLLTLEARNRSVIIDPTT